MGLLRKPKRTPLKTTPWRAGGGTVSALRPYHMEKPAPCSASCPIGNDVRGATTIVAQRQKLGLGEAEALDRAWHLLAETTPFPAVMGRICPHLCEERCNRREKDEAVAIGAFERFLGDWGIARRLLPAVAPCADPFERPVAVVGAGPSGLACAYHLVKRGHRVTVFENLPRPGGMLRYGVPSYRLSRDVLDAEVERLERMGIELRCGVKVGEQVSFDELRETHSALFVGIGAHRSRRLGIPGEEGPSVYSGIEFLRCVNSERSLDIGPRVLVTGDGQTAVDAARVAHRLGRRAKTPDYRVTLVRSHAQSQEDLADLAQEGIAVEYGVMATAVLRGDGGRVAKVEAHRARPGGVTSDGVPLPAPVEGTRFHIEADTLIAAISQYPDLEPLGAFSDVQTWLEVDAWGRTPLGGVWSGGDDVTLGIAARSIAQGMRAAISIDAHLRGVEVVQPPVRQPVSTGRVKLGAYEHRPRSTQHRLAVEERLHNLEAEVEQGITRQQAVYEAGRCLSCGACYGCERCWMFCTPGCFAKAKVIEHRAPYFVIDPAACDGCRKCADECPSGFIEMR